MIYCYNPAYVNGECQENIDIMKDEKLIPFIVSVDVAISESTALADLILPDVTYLERWTWEDMASYAMIPEFYESVVNEIMISEEYHDQLPEGNSFVFTVPDQVHQSRP